MTTLTINQFINSIIQIILFSIIPFIWWLITARKKENFFSWLGLKRPAGDRKELLLFIIGGFAICEIVGMVVYNVLLKTDWNTSTFAGMGVAGLPCAIFYSYLQTALSEEIVFRGFIQKRLQSKLGFKAATIIQAALFGAIHVVMALGQINVAQGLALFLYPMLPGVVLAYINEKKADGSILPSWLIHGTLNLITQIIQL
ncbi:CPBP family intramembrane glutamic endopeptidase [Butyrivibrio proteoclasticus]|uniref:CPBP family intramembrane glutamic endopeptidase n=1 Tax=Butyrivibrio proteoclasticus TaxID=43305 RepID=UPI00047EAAD1|nr:CPBP family intramembrane glutamic endopeptidase [Butyrivibrio proteoclasticus]